jgi:hypothetical protein
VIDALGRVEPYVSIKEAEGRHVEALTRQLERLGVDVPGNPYLGTVKAPVDLVAAAKEGVAGEVANVAMYDTLLTKTTDAVLTRVLENLRRASDDVHLPLFTAAAANDGSLTTQQMADLDLGMPH